MKKRPNIILVTTDQHRGDCVGFEGRKAKTPHLDAFAERGTRFASSTSAIRHAARTRIGLIGTFAGGTVVGRKTNGEYRAKRLDGRSALIIGIDQGFVEACIRECATVTTSRINQKFDQQGLRIE